MASVAKSRKVGEIAVLQLEVGLDVGPEVCEEAAEPEPELDEVLEAASAEPGSHFSSTVSVVKCVQVDALSRSWSPYP
ncbi:MAG: hypothetical protein OK441_02210 [Thaumarchaeota archaeon]|nr:hypothetical protein [Nitrososphaerota archaeon]